MGSAGHGQQRVRSRLFRRRGKLPAGKRFAAARLFPQRQKVRLGYLENRPLRFDIEAAGVDFDLIAEEFDAHGALALEHGHRSRIPPRMEYSPTISTGSRHS